MLWPEAVQNLPNVSHMQSTWSTDARAKRRTSSANIKCDIRGPLLEACNGFHSPWAIFRLINWLRRSKHKTNRYEESGSPWRSPRVGLIRSVHSPFHTSRQELLRMTHYGIYKTNRKGDIPQRLVDKRPLHPVISLFQIELQNHTPTRCLSKAERMKKLLADNNVIRYMSSGEKRGVIRSHNRRQNPLQSINYHLTHDLDWDVAQAKWSKSFHWYWIDFLRDNN